MRRNIGPMIQALATVVRTGNAPQRHARHQRCFPGQGERFSVQPVFKEYISFSTISVTSPKPRTNRAVGSTTGCGRFDSCTASSLAQCASSHSRAGFAGNMSFMPLTATIFSAMEMIAARPDSSGLATKTLLNVFSYTETLRDAVTRKVRRFHRRCKPALPALPRCQAG